MATLRQIVYNLKNIMRGGTLSDDEPMSDRQVAYIFKNLRAKYAKQAMEANKDISNMYQDLGCLDVICADKSDCCNIKTDCYILRTKDKIPNLINHKNALFYLGLVDKQRAFEFTSYNQARWSTYSKWTSRVPRAYWFQDYIYIINQDILEFINIVGLFEDPEKAAKLNPCQDCPENFWDNDYPIDGWMIADIERDIQNIELRTMALLTRQDEKNDARSTTAKEEPA